MAEDAAMKRREFTRDVKAEIMRRCEVPTGFRCEACGLIVTKGEIDHEIPEALILDKSRKLTAEDGKFLCWDCHQGPEGKTPKDKGLIAKAKNVEATRFGIKRARGQGFARPPKPPRETTKLDQLRALRERKWT